MADEINLLLLLNNNTRRKKKLRSEQTRPRTTMILISRSDFGCQRKRLSSCFKR